MGTGVDVLHYGVFLLGIEVGGTEDSAPDVGLTVASLGHEHLGHGPAGGQQGGYVGLLQLHQGIAIDIAEHGYGSHIRPGIHIGEDGTVRIESNDMIGRLRRQVSNLQCLQV